jgi:hypothetical protein
VKTGLFVSPVPRNCLLIGAGDLSIVEQNNQILVGQNPVDKLVKL